MPKLQALAMEFHDIKSEFGLDHIREALPRLVAAKKLKRLHIGFRCPHANIEAVKFTSYDVDVLALTVHDIAEHSVVEDFTLKVASVSNGLMPPLTDDNQDPRTLFVSKEDDEAIALLIEQLTQMEELKRLVIGWNYDRTDVWMIMGLIEQLRTDQERQQRINQQRTERPDATFDASGLVRPTFRDYWPHLEEFHIVIQDPIPYTISQCFEMVLEDMRMDDVIVKAHINELARPESMLPSLPPPPSPPPPTEPYPVSSATTSQQPRDEQHQQQSDPTLEVTTLEEALRSDTRSGTQEGTMVSEHGLLVSEHSSSPDHRETSSRSQQQRSSGVVEASGQRNSVVENSSSGDRSNPSSRSVSSGFGGSSRRSADLSGGNHGVPRFGRLHEAAKVMSGSPEQREMLLSQMVASRNSGRGGHTRGPLAATISQVPVTGLVGDGGEMSFGHPQPRRELFKSTAGPSGLRAKPESPRSTSLMPDSPRSEGKEVEVDVEVDIVVAEEAMPLVPSSRQLHRTKSAPSSRHLHTGRHLHTDTKQEAAKSQEKTPEQTIQDMEREKRYVAAMRRMYPEATTTQEQRESRMAEDLKTHQRVANFDTIIAQASTSRSLQVVRRPSSSESQLRVSGGDRSQSTAHQPDRSTRGRPRPTPQSTASISMSRESHPHPSLSGVRSQLEEAYHTSVQQHGSSSRTDVENGTGVRGPGVRHKIIFIRNFKFKKYLYTQFENINVMYFQFYFYHYDIIQFQIFK